jgi:hypothetical protein
MTQLTPRETITQHKEDLTKISHELQSEELTSENLRTINDLIWWIKSIENIEDYQRADDYTVQWILDCGFNKCPLRQTRNSDENRLCVEVDCPRFNKCELTRGILDKYM